ncbi:unnamed protein product [Leptosia nina]|uniref:Peptidase S1 domain-containing protein n=1 Tax=Leptosia nina TaxID=320188 RepID=A0AAV1IZR6_9NEOP
MFRALFLLTLAVSAYANEAVYHATSQDYEDAVASQGRIVSGWEAYEGQFPFQLSLRMVNRFGRVTACGATLIHNEWILTAAHCPAQRVTLVVRLGATDLKTPRILLETTEYYLHPTYIESAPFVQPNDISLVKLPRRVDYTPLIQPIRIQASADKNKNYEGITLTAFGWGRNWTEGVSPEIMNWVYLKGVSNAQCKLDFGGSSTIVDSTVCGRYFNVTSQSVCQGDSGGGLTVRDVDGKVTQIGIASFVHRDGCHTEKPGGFIRPGHYHDWIERVTGMNFDWVPEEEEDGSGLFDEGFLF